MTEHYKYEGEELSIFNTATNWKQYVASRINPFIRGDVAEVGAGPGNFTPYLYNSQVKSWTFIEPDKGYSLLLRQKVNEGIFKASTVINGRLNDVPANEKFDTILYMDVLEHIQNDQAEVALMQAHLNPGGYIIILSPAFQYLYTSFDKKIGHFRRYNKPVLKALFADQQDIKICKYLDSVGVFTSLANKWFLRQSYPSLRQIEIWDKWIVPLSKKVDLFFSGFVGRSLLLVWHKK